MIRHHLRAIRRSRPRREGPDRERGQILVLFTIVLVVILGFTALVVDLGMLRNDRQTLANAMDAGALAGGTLLPVDGSQPGAAADIDALIQQTVAGTYPGLSTADYDIEYRCLIGTGAGNAGAFDPADIDAFIPLDCDPSHAIGHTPPLVGDFIGAGKTRSTDCRPDLGDKCNVVVVDGNVTTPYTFGRVVGVNSGDTGVVTSAACRGLCGELPDTPFDVVMVLDTSGSMQTMSSGQTRLYWAKKAANELIDSLEDARGVQRVGLVRYSGLWSDVLPPPAEELSPLTTDFGAVRAEIATLVGSGYTPLKQGMAMGTSVVTADPRPGVTEVIVLLSDGAPCPDNSNTRPNAGEINTFKASADQVYSVAIGQGGSSGNCSLVDLGLMTSLAKPDDGTHYFNVVDASNLPDVFRQIAVELLDPKSRLIKVYPAPIVTGVGGTGTVSISGKYFTGAIKVTFGGANAAFTVNSDTSITATAPNGNPGDTVHVRVITQGGASPTVAADSYTYPP